MRISGKIAFVLLACLPGIAAASLQCSETDRKGNRSVATIITDKAGAVQSFHWSMRTREGASCEFDSSNFSISPQSKGVEYQSANGCRLFIWRQGDGITLAHNACEAQCTGPEAHDYLWPIVFDRRGKVCGRSK
jgi:hypothetical protein